MTWFCSISGGAAVELTAVLGYVLQQMDHFLYCRILHNLMNNDGGKPKEKEDCATAENLESVS